MATCDSTLDLFLTATAHRSPATATAYRTDLAQCAAWFGRPLCELRLADALAWRAHLETAGNAGRPYSAATVRRRLDALRSFVAWAARRADDGARWAAAAAELRDLGVPRVRTSPVRRAPQAAETRALLAGAGSALDRAVLLLLYCGGLRVSELCALTWGDVLPQPDGGASLRVGTKTGQREVRLEPAQWAELVALLPAADSGPVVRRAGAALSRHQVRRITRRTSRAVGLARRVSPHALRHGHACDAVRAGGAAALRAVQEQLGHASLATTGVYLSALGIQGSGAWLDVPAWDGAGRLAQGPEGALTPAPTYRRLQVM
jgi:integrase/recombinase XerD